MKIMEVRIEGIHCAGCINRIEMQLKRHGAAHVDLDLGTRIATIEYDELQTDPTKLVEQIHEIGYRARLIP